MTGTVATQGGAGECGKFHLKCSGSDEEVAAFFERELKRAGMEIRKPPAPSSDGAVIILSGSGAAKRQTIEVTVTSTDDGADAEVVCQVGK